MWDLLRLCPMREDNGKTEKLEDCHSNDPGDRPAVPYTAEQRRMIRKGLRIWARVAIRSYMRKHGDGSLTRDDGEG